MVYNRAVSNAGTRYMYTRIYTGACIHTSTHGGIHRHRRPSRSLSRRYYARAIFFSPGKIVEIRRETHPHSSASCCSVTSTISSSKIRSSPPNTDISRWSARPRVPSNEFHVPDTAVVAGLREDDGLRCSSLLCRSHSFSPGGRCFVRSFACSPDRALHRGGGRGGGTNNPRFIKHTSPFRCNVRIRWYTRVTTRGTFPG